MTKNRNYLSTCKPLKIIQFKSRDLHVTYDVKNVQYYDSVTDEWSH